jgi:hypothetical protein
MLINYQIAMSCARIDDRIESQRFVQIVMIDLAVDLELFGDNVDFLELIDDPLTDLTSGFDLFTVIARGIKDNFFVFFVFLFTALFPAVSEGVFVGVGIYSIYR